jgi:hypothetical protein
METPEVLGPKDINADTDALCQGLSAANSIDPCRICCRQHPNMLQRLRHPFRDRDGETSYLAPLDVPSTRLHENDRHVVVVQQQKCDQFAGALCVTVSAPRRRTLRARR